MPRFDNLSPGELEEIRRFIEESDIDVIDDEMRALVEKHRPELLSNLPPQTNNRLLCGPGRREAAGHVSIFRRRT
jgi:hypothetical protein